MLDLGSHPLTMQFAGELVGASPDGSQLLVRVTAGKPK